MKEDGIVPYSGIDTDARWGYSHTKGWKFGYKLHMICSIDSPVIVLLSADVTTANGSDKPVYSDLRTSSTPSSTPSTSSNSLSQETLKKIHFIVVDPGYDEDQSLYDKPQYGILACLSSSKIRKCTRRKAQTG